MQKMTRRQVLYSSATAGLSLTAAWQAEAKSDKTGKLKLLVAGAHPDDPESACGGVIALYADAGHEVVCLYLTRGEAGIRGKSHDEAARIRTAEAEKACKILKARPVFLTQVDGATTVNAAAYDEMRKAIEDEKPDIVITHWPIDGHRDHRAIALLVYDAWLHMGRSFLLYYFEVEMGQQTQHFHPTHYVDISSVLERKKEANHVHVSQNAENGFYKLHERMHRIRGLESGVSAAEAFIAHCQNKKAML